MADIIQYLCSLPKATLDEMYDDTWTCQAVLRALLPVAKQIVMRMLFTPAISIETLKSWAMMSGTNKANESSINQLSSLKLVLKIAPPPGETGSFVHLHDKFKNQVANSLCSSSMSAFSVDKKPNPKQDHVPDTTSLDEYARQRWDDVLHFLVGSAARPPSQFMVDLLAAAELMSWESDDRLRITNKGFKFLLKDVHTQIWELLLQYINSADTRKVDDSKGNGEYVVRKEMLSFLLRTSFLIFGQGYPVKELTSTQESVMKNLREFGLIYLRKDSSNRFYPTRLAISLCSGKAAATPIGHETSKAEKDGFIVVESNFRIYAYTSSSLKISLLSLFVKMQYRLPNFAMGVITRESVRTALLNGISADQMISFMQQNVHEQAIKRGTPIPETVIDQIRLWEAERNRVLYQKGFMYDGFANEAMYRDVVQYAKQLSVFLYSNDEKRYLMASETGHEQLKVYIKRKYG